MWGRRDLAAGERFAERREREDRAPRLSETVPALDALTLQIRETSASGSCPEAAHLRRVVVEHAPALIFIVCHDSYCRDGGHDISREVLRALGHGQTEFTGEHRCRGHVGNRDCERTLHFAGAARYRSGSV
jgi:hypothetical protein